MRWKCSSVTAGSNFFSPRSVTVLSSTVTSNSSSFMSGSSAFSTSSCSVAVNVDRWHPRAAGDVFLRTDVEALEHPAHSLLQRGHITGRIPANDSHDDSPVLIPSVAVTPLRRSRGTGIRHADRECHDGKALVRAVAQGR